MLKAIWKFDHTVLPLSFFSSSFFFFKEFTRIFGKLFLNKFTMLSL